MIGNMVKIELPADESSPEKYKRCSAELFLDENKIYLDLNTETEVQAQGGGKVEKAEASKDKKNKLVIIRDESGKVKTGKFIEVWRKWDLMSVLWVCHIGSFQFPGGSVDFFALKTVIIPEDYIKKSTISRLIPIGKDCSYPLNYF